MNFSRPLFTIIFGPNRIFLGTDSISRVKTMVVSQPYSMLKAPYTHGIIKV